MNWGVAVNRESVSTLLYHARMLALTHINFCLHLLGEIAMVVSTWQNARRKLTGCSMSGNFGRRA